MLKIEGLNLVLVGLTASIPLLAPFFPLLKDFISSTINSVIKERNAIEKLRLDLDNLVAKERYIQEINILNSRTLKSITFEKVNLLLRKDIDLTQLINMSEITKKDLCTYLPASKEIQIVSKNYYKAIKKKDIHLHLYFTLFLTLMILLLIDIIFYQEVISMALLFILALFFEVVWLLRKSPYDSYKELTKDEERKNSLRMHGIIVD